MKHVMITIEGNVTIQEAIMRVANVIHWACAGDLENEPYHVHDSETSEDSTTAFPSGVFVNAKTPTDFHVYREW